MGVFRSSNYAEQSRSTSPFALLRLCTAAHNDFWLVTLTYARYFEQTPAFYSYIRRNRNSATRRLIPVQAWMCSIAREIKEERKSIVNCGIESRESFQLFYIRYGMENTIRENFCNEKKRNKNSKLLNGM